METALVIELELPFPPSVNHYWRRVGARTLISRGGRHFRKTVVSILASRGVRPLDGPLEVYIELYPPDRRRRDVDNSQKALLDALGQGGAYHDDSQIIHLDTWKRGPTPGGKTFVRISQCKEGK
jgi:crossover junction endodeoxyribonuclease RusA